MRQLFRGVVPTGGEIDWPKRGEVMLCALSLKIVMRRPMTHVSYHPTDVELCLHRERCCQLVTVS